MTIDLKCSIMNIVKQKETDIMNKVKKVAETIMIVLCVAFILWSVMSFVEVNMKNLTENPVYSCWNLFEIYLKILTKT